MSTSLALRTERQPRRESAGYLPRRLRPSKGPKWALITPAFITHEQAAEIKRAWRVAQRKETVVLANGFDVRRLR
jgi:hypothetical protein